MSDSIGSNFDNGLCRTMPHESIGALPAGCNGTVSLPERGKNATGLYAKSVRALPAECDGTGTLPERGKNATGILVKAACRMWWDRWST